MGGCKASQECGQTRRQGGCEEDGGMEGVFEDIAFETDQMLINVTEYCD
jgi:hypothetical protein